MSGPNQIRDKVRGFHRSDILSQLDRIRQSYAMSGCRKLSHFLSFVVEETINGKSEHLKETTIGVFVFGRRPDYDPKVDTIVRSEAWRLRAKLKQYYAMEGAQDPIVIHLPKGRYVPVFVSREDQTVK